MVRMTMGLLPVYKVKNISTHKHANLDVTFKSTLWTSEQDTTQGTSSWSVTLQLTTKQRKLRINLFSEICIKYN